MVKSQGPQQIEVYSRHQLPGTATPNHSIDLGPPDAGGGLGEHREGGDWGRNRAGRQAGSERCSFPEGFRLQSFSQPAHPPSVLPPGSKVRDRQMLHGDHRDRVARAKAAVSQAGATVQDVSSSKI